jgi:hypothetical protein
VKSQRPLDWLNFFLADVKDGLGPFLAICLLSSRHWDPGEICVVMMIAGIATVAARGPFGALIDWTRWERALIVIAAVTVAVGAVLTDQRDGSSSCAETIRSQINRFHGFE